MFSIEAIVPFLLGIGGYILNFFDKDKHPKRYITASILLLILFSLAFWLEKNEAESELKSSQQRNEGLTMDVVSLKTLALNLSSKIDSLETILTYIAEKEHPEFPKIDALKMMVGEELSRNATIGVSDFYRGLRRLDTHFKEISFDSVVYDNVRRNMYTSGPYFEGMKMAAIAFHRQRTDFIDSSLVRLKQFGVDTDTLKYPKKLPIRIGTVLSEHAKSVGMDERAIIGFKNLDTL